MAKQHISRLEPVLVKFARLLCLFALLLSKMVYRRLTAAFLWSANWAPLTVGLRRSPFYCATAMKLRRSQAFPPTEKARTSNLKTRPRILLKGAPQTVLTFDLGGKRCQESSLICISLQEMKYRNDILVTGKRRTVIIGALRESRHSEWRKRKKSPCPGWRISNCSPEAS